MRILRFDEKTLNNFELTKPAVAGGTRGDLLVTKLKKQIEDPQDTSNMLTFNTFSKGQVPLPVDNAEEIIDNITDGEEKVFDIEKATSFLSKPGPRYLDKFKTGEDIYKLNNIEQTPDFSSSSGSSLGAEKTMILESIQCIYCALRQYLGRDIKVEDLDSLFDDNGEINPKILIYVRINKKLNRDIVEELHNEWYQTLISTANSLFTSKPLYTEKAPHNVLKVEDNNGQFLYSVLDPKIRYIFYQINFKSELISTMRNSYKKFEDCSKIAFEKWNPSDMWAVNSATDIYSQIINRINRTQTVTSLNGVVDSNFKSRDLVGVSLKKIPTLTQPTLLINKITPRPKYKFLKVRTSNVPLNSLGVHVILQQESSLESECRTISLNLRTFAGDKVADITGEVIGTTSRHGKISLYWMNRILSKFQEKTKVDIGYVQTYDELKSKSDEELMSEIVQMNDFIKSVGDRTNQKRDEEKISNRVRLVSKYQALKLACMLYDISTIDVELYSDYRDKYSDLLCQDIMYYALAIQNEVFTSPMYVRVL
jgi:hypothetical protein